MVNLKLEIYEPGRSLFRLLNLQFQISNFQSRSVIMKLVVGLGNPGSKYDGTRHNIGFAVIDYLAAGAGVGVARSRFSGQIAEWRLDSETILLVKPDTYMNLSGQCVRQVIEFYKIPTPELLVICDDIALPLGKLRVRAKGSDGGQKGLRNITDQLGTPEFGRLRIGVGDPSGMDAADFVLSRFKPGERASVEEAIQSAGNGVMIWIRDGIEACKNRDNGGHKKANKTKKEKPKKADEDTATDSAGRT